MLLNRSHRLLLAVAAVATTAGCGPTGTVVPEESRTGASIGAPLLVTRLRAEPFSFTSASGYRAPQRAVIGDSAAWQAAWSTLWAGSTSAPPLPAVDFAREVIVLAALGERPTGGYQILVDSATAGEADGAVVHVRTVSPGARCNVFQALTQPVDVARLPRVRGPVTFRDHALVLECE
jgi:hypothetical protein